MSPQERTTMMINLAEGWQESGMTQARYAQRNNISVHTLKYWIYKRKRYGHTSGGFVQIGDISTGQEIVLRYPNGVELTISSNTPVALIKSLVNLQC